MKKLLGTIAILSLTNLQAFANNENLSSPIQFSITYPLSTNGMKATEYTNGGSVNLLAGVSKNEKYFTLSGISNIISGNAGGLQLAGISNHIGKSGHGLSVAGITNTVAESYDGVQISGIWNVAGNNSKGVMISGIGNLTKGSFSGFQLGGIINMSGNINGLQFAGLVNKAGKVRGVQFATLVNIAEENDFPIGLVNIIKNGEKGVSLTYDILGNSVLSFRSGGRYTYGILGIGYNHRLKSGNKMVAEAGYGIHIPIVYWLQINNEFKATSIGCMGNTTESGNITNIGYLLAPSFILWKHINIFGGPSLNYYFSDSAGSADLLPQNSLWNNESGDKLQRVYIGYQAGLKYIF